MKFTLFLSFTIFLTAQIYADGQDKTCAYAIDSGYIKMEYSKETSKPFNVIIFYLSNSIDTSFEKFFVYKKLITPNQFITIDSLIQNSRLTAIVVSLPDSYWLQSLKMGRKWNCNFRT